MATKTTGNLIPSNTNVPLDARARISSLEDMVNIGNPYIGLIVYVVSTGKLYVVTGLKSKEVDGVLVENAAVDTYEELEGISNIAIGGVTTVAATEQAHVEVVKTGTTATLHFAIPQGEDGKDGEQGIQGERGEIGPAMKIDAMGTLDERTNYDDQPRDFTFFDIDNVKLYIKISDESGAWSSAIDIKGHKGDTGEQGPQGPTGPQGPKGDQGAVATISIGTVTTLQPNESATAIIRYDEVSNVYYLDLGIPKGDMGDAGEESAELKDRITALETALDGVNALLDEILGTTPEEDNGGEA
jgi:hypothetical protein